MKQLTTARNIGLGVQPPKETCDDPHCTFHGHITVRGRQFVAAVTRASAQKTAVIEWDYTFYIPKYERYEKRRSRLHVHNPKCISAKVGDVVRVVECKPISKTKTFVIVEKVKTEQ